MWDQERPKHSVVRNFNLKNDISKNSPCIKDRGHVKAARMKSKERE